MDTNTADGARAGLWNRWPATTLSALAGLTSLAVLLASPTIDVPQLEDPTGALEEEEPPSDQENTDEEAGSGSRHKGEEGKMGKPTSKSKSGLYAMKGPKDAIPASPHGAAFAVGGDDSDVWGGLTGTEIGEAYGVGGLGLVGTGRGGGGTGEGTIGLGSGYGRGSRASESSGRYDTTLQSRVLTVGTTDDNADPKAYKQALERMSHESRALGIAADTWHLTAPKYRHIARPRNLDIALVIDTTGSMGDELEYLKVEIRDIARQVAADFPGVDQRWGLVVYRDKGDEYVTRDADFQSIEKFVDALGKQEANGGGDLPEAMHATMQSSERLSWRGDDNTARMVFLVADAPTHDGAESRAFATSVLAHRATNTAIYPIAGSGVHTAAEAELRLAAKVTGGQYIFLTDHSGVGGSHAAPHVEQYKVENLHDAMFRMIRLELGGHGSARPLPGPVGEPVVVHDVPNPVCAASDPAILNLAPVPTSSDALWAEFTDRVAAHLLFVGAMSIVVFTAMGFDTWYRRRRRIGM